MSTKGPAAGSLIEELAVASDSSILLAVIDGLGDIPSDELGGLTPLEAASTPVMDGLAGSSALGLHVPVAHGITPGSGPAAGASCLHSASGSTSGPEIWRPGSISARSTGPER